MSLTQWARDNMRVTAGKRGEPVYTISLFTQMPALTNAPPRRIIVVDMESVMERVMEQSIESSVPIVWSSIPWQSIRCFQHTWPACAIELDIAISDKQGDLLGEKKLYDTPVESRIALYDKARDLLVSLMSYWVLR